MLRTRTCAPFLLAGFLCAGATVARAGFHPNQRLDVPTGEAPQAIVVADFDGDGRPDVATGNFTASSVSILLSRPGRAFAVRADSPLSFGPTRLIAADLNGDGCLDLVAAGWPAAALTVLVNDGAGRFGAGAPIAVAAEPTGIAAGDWNEDGKLDLAIAHEGPTQVGFLYGDGAGGFGGEGIRSCGSSPYAIRSADLNGDGHDDLALTNPGSASVSVLLGAGTGGFSDGGTLAVGTAPSDLAIGDLDGDGIPDLVVNNFTSGTLSVLKGLGGGAFAPPADRIGGGISVTAVDVNEDGHLDLLVGRSSGSSVSVLCNDGTGAFPAQSAMATELPAGQAPLAVAAGDLDGDGSADVVCANRNANSVTVHFGYRLAEFQPLREFATGPSPLALALGDVDGDGDLDVATANWLGNSLSVLRGDGAGSLGARANFPLGLAMSVRIADVDGDGHPDLVGACGADGSVDVFAGDGAGNFADPIASPGGNSPRSLAVADLDGDSHPDLLFACSDRVQSALGQGDGTFAQVDSHPASGANQVVLAPIDGDALLDAVAVIPGAYLLEIFHGFGNGSFASPLNVPVAGEPSGVAIADFSGDGRPDLALSMRGHWGGPPIVPNLDVFLVGDGFEAIAAGDLNGDGRPDVACASPAGHQVSVFHAAAGSLADRVDLETGPHTADVALGDLNGDGVADVVATDFSSTTGNQVAVFLTRIGTRTTLAVSPAVLQPGGALTLDADVATAAAVPGSGTVTFFDRGTPLATVPLAGGHAHVVLPAPTLPTGTIVAVYAGSAAMRGSASDPASVRVVRAGTTAVAPPSAASLRILGPNPIEGRHLSLTLAGGPPLPGRVEIFDPAGRRVAGVPVAAGSGLRAIEVELPAGSRAGIYFVRARRGGAAALRRVAILP